MAKLYVICGHGAGDSGACGNGYQEAERVRVLGKLIKELGGDNVMLGDINRNYYADNGISNLVIPSDYQIIELHMDSAGATARGAHVIIYGGTTQDKYDKALAKYLSGLLPGRSSTIVGRDDLANPARAYAAGYSYRLVEVGFISNAEDVKIFNNNIENIAKGILGCFDIPVVGGSQENHVTSPKPSTPSNDKPVSKTRYSVGTPVCVNTIWTQANGGTKYKGDWQGKITKVIAGAEHPYLIDNGDIGWTNDMAIDSDPHTPSGTSKSTSKPSGIRVGDWVGIRNGAKTYNGKGFGGVTGKVYYTADEIKGNRVVLDIPGICTPFNIKDLFK